MKNLILLFALVCLFGLSSCGSSEINEVKKSFATQVSEKVRDASVHSLNCKTGDAVYSMTHEKLSEVLKIQSEQMGLASMGIVKNLCEYGVTTVFPYFVDMGTGKLPQSWLDDGCNMDSVGDDLKTVAKDLCGKIE